MSVGCESRISQHVCVLKREGNGVHAEVDAKLSIVQWCEKREGGREKGRNIQDRAMQRLG